jgi:hypothetical protein
MDLADLRQLLAEEAARVDFEAADPDQLVHIVRMRRRWRAIVGGALGATAVVVGVVVGVTSISSDAGGRATVVPAAPTTATASPTPPATPTPDEQTPWGINASGQTFGEANARGWPDLIRAYATNGRFGYAFSTQIGPNAWPQPANPAQALEWQNTPLVTVHVPVYLSDGKTRIGQIDEQIQQAYVDAGAKQRPQPHPTPQPRPALIPNVAGMDINTAAKALKTAGFRPVDGGGVARSSTPGTVAFSTPGGGFKAPIGSAVTIYSSTG